MPILGIVAAAGGFTKFGDFYQIATSTASTGSVADFTFSNIPQDYTHLHIRILSKATDSGTVTNGNLLLQFNSDTGSNYASHYLIGNGTSASSGATTSGTFIYSGKRGNAATSNIFGAVIIDILDYTNTNKYKTVKILTGVDANGSGESNLNSGHWRNTNAITSLKFTSDAGNFGQYMNVSLYGIKAS